LGQDIFDKLGMSHLRSRTSNQPMASQTPMTSTSYTVPLDHFTSTTSSHHSFIPIVGWFSLDSSSPYRWIYHGPTRYACFYQKCGHHSTPYWDTTST
jgi:hypothetical protein